MCLVRSLLSMVQSELYSASKRGLLPRTRRQRLHVPSYCQQGSAVRANVGVGLLVAAVALAVVI